MNEELAKVLINRLIDILKGVLIFGFTSLITIIFVKKSIVQINLQKS